MKPDANHIRELAVAQLRKTRSGDCPIVDDTAVVVKDNGVSEAVLLWHPLGEKDKPQARKMAFRGTTLTKDVPCRR